MDRKQGDPCYYVRKFVFPPSTDIGIIVVAILVIIVNGIALISVLRNYRRLRQRIYVFVISLGIADILGGVVYLADAINRVINQTNYDWTIRDTFIDESVQPYGSRIITLTYDHKDFDTSEFIQGLKAGCIIVSVLNTALVTFALYKRTTSMGKHHEDFRNLDGAMGADGSSFLPAFDTMMRVLSIGNPAAANGISKSMGAKSGHVAQKNGDYRRTSNTSRVSYSSTQPDVHGSGSRKSQVVHSSTENSSPRKGFKTTRNSSFSRLVHSGGRRLSHAFRSRSVSGAQSYVGRHSNSVMSTAATRCSLFLVWLTFIAICFIPLALHRIGSSAFCSVGCHASDIWEIYNMSAVAEGNEDFETLFPKEANTSGFVRNTPGNISVQEQSDCIPVGYSQVFDKRLIELGKHEESGAHAACSACSAAFFPLSKSYQIFTAMIMLINWIWLVTSSARLLYLRKHSSNVFVRCSALWRFMFMIALFYFVTLLPSVIWMILDFQSSSSAIKSPLWYAKSISKANNGSTYANSQLDHYGIVVEKDSSRLYPHLGAISVCLLLIHFAVTPSLYLVRLLGFRRIISVN